MAVNHVASRARDPVQTRLGPPSPPNWLVLTTGPHSSFSLRSDVSGQLQWTARWCSSGSLLLRIDGDSDEANTWHPVHEIKDPFGDIDGVITVALADGKPVNDTDEVEFALLRRNF